MKKRFVILFMAIMAFIFTFGMAGSAANASSCKHPGKYRSNYKYISGSKHSYYCKKCKKTVRESHGETKPTLTYVVKNKDLPGSLKKKYCSVTYFKKCRCYDCGGFVKSDDTKEYCPHRFKFRSGSYVCCHCGYRK